MGREGEALAAAGHHMAVECVPKVPGHVQDSRHHFHFYHEELGMEDFPVVVMVE